MRREIDLQLRGMESGGRGAGTVAFTISYQGFDPVTVASVANTLASSYVEENTRVRERQASGTADFLRRQLESTKDRLDAQERKVSDFKKRFLGETPQQLGANLAILERLNTELRRNADQQTRSMQRRGVIEAQMGLAAQLAETERRRARDSAIPALPDRTGGAASPGEMVDPLAERLAKLQAELAELRTRFSDRYPDVMAKKAEIATVAQQLREAPPARASEPGPSPAALPASAASPAADAVATPAFVPRDPTAVRLQQTLLEIDGELRSLKDEEARLRQTVATYQGRIENAPRREQEFEEISRDYDTTRELYRTLLKRYEEAQLAESLEQRQKGEQFRILDPAVPNPRPAAPARLMLLAMALVGSLGFAAAVVIAAEATDTSFHGVDDLRVFSGAVPVLVSIPWITTSAYRLRRERRMRLSSMAAAVAVVVIFVASYLVAHGNERLVALLARGGS
jgi:polysaccharide chain length determinant protein (PEP-CTERM system associated)